MSRKSKALEFANAVYPITITGRHIEVTDSMRDYALEKASKLERFSNRIIDISVIMDIQKLVHSVEVIVKVNDQLMRSLAESEDIYTSIDKAVDKAEAQLLKYKSKMNDHHVKNRPISDMKVNVVRLLPKGEEAALDIEDEDEYSIGQSRKHEVVSQEVRPLKMLTINEALLKMEMSDDIFHVFKDEADQQLKVIYRRKDGHYGILQPQS